MQYVFLTYREEKYTCVDLKKTKGLWKASGEGDTSREKRKKVKQENVEGDDSRDRYM